ncbi:MAG: hypothetical protein K2X91_16820, partial [Thermoleophilia bacterium]|nr:hypothetical protein [Thermoleophilia bacterium]
HRFLAQHGARPRVVWLARLSAWGLGFLVLMLLLGLIAAAFPRPMYSDPTSVILLVSALPTGFAAGTLGGMLARRGITALLLSLLGTLAVALMLGPLVVVKMMPIGGVVAIAAGILFVTAVWAGDWLYDRPAPGRWIRLAAWSSATFATLFLAYISHRVYAVEAVPPVAPPASWAEGARPDVSALYDEALKSLTPLPPQLNGVPTMPVWNPPSPVARAYVERNAAALALIRRAAMLPGGPFDRRPGADLFATDVRLIDYRLPWLLGMSADLRREAGDLDGSWEDVKALLGLARQRALPATLTDARFGRDLENRAIARALRWANAPKQTAERLRRGVGEYRAL